MKKQTKQEKLIAAQKCYQQGFEVGKAQGISEGYEKCRSEIRSQNAVHQAKLEARIKLINAAGQAYHAISVALHDDSIAGHVL